MRYAQGIRVQGSEVRGTAGAAEQPKRFNARDAKGRKGDERL